ncbi:peptidase M48 Ste24p [Ancylobacter novellus DSM 506]|uniref:Peptidase M48 Ste24p n=1 Tax=Ancylobacter novellus (strain ATCC 8093 / DSM 506 / JCM 20403 / CCM 1077 / IAM 12100 / NBRC 12443 / NCIMB 10456) TaxID=639283 RepID=D7AAU7_ANCN5|nr:M48 family metalloprotease [Ancylobacter novellus]ADH90964.1 peptidase M48 Ste24p [Ancylobacter novellus DSM 506]
MSRGLALALALGGSLLLGACAALNDSTSATAPTPPPRLEEALTPAQRQEHERLVASYGGAYNNPKLQAQIEGVVNRLVAASERPNLHYRVTILNSPAVNAFALPNGSLYVTRGLLSLASDNSELASVLSHEMAHVIANHAATREDQMKQAVLVSRVISDVVNDSDLGALALARSRISLASFSRGQELEADAIGVGISARAGFDPYGAERFLTTMGRQASIRSSSMSQSAGAEATDFLATHPANPERISIVMANAREYASPDKPGERDRKQYLAAIDGLVYGDDPKEGFVRGRRFFHPKLGFTFTAPEGFTLENTSQAVLGASTSGREALRLDAVRVAGDQSLAQYLSSGWIEGVEISTVESLVLNGFPAATAVARGEQWSFRMFAIRFGSDVYRLIFAARQLTPELDKQFREAAETFRRVSIEEAENVKPLRIRIVTAGLTDNSERMAAKMDVQDRALERFLVLNGLNKGDKLSYGEQYKIIAE